MGFIFKIINLFLLLIVLALVFHNWTAKQALKLVLSHELGVPVDIDGARLNFLKGEVEFDDIVLYQPDGFEEGNEVMADIPLIFMDFNWDAVWEGKLHFQTVGLDFQELNLVRNSEGRLNLLALNVLQPGKSGGNERTRERRPTPSRRSERRAAPRVKLDNFVLTLGEVSYTDLNFPPGPARTRTFNLKIREAVFKDVKSIGDITDLIAGEVLKRTGLEQIVDQLIGAQVGNLREQAGNFAGKAISDQFTAFSSK